MSASTVRIIITALILITACSQRLAAQYSPDVFKLKKQQELYDERGFQQGAAISVDGKLNVSTSNGNVSYSYPISKSTLGGYPLEVNLNYCGSVAFTAFRLYA